MKAASLSVAVLVLAASFASTAGRQSSSFSTEAIAGGSTGVWHPSTLTLEITLPSDRKVHDVFVNKKSLAEIGVLPFVVTDQLASFEINVVRITGHPTTWQSAWIASGPWHGIGTLLEDDTLAQRTVWISLLLNPSASPSPAALACLCPADFNADGATTAADAAAFSAVYVSGGPSADIDMDACVTPCDFDIFMANIP